MKGMRALVGTATDDLSSLGWEIADRPQEPERTRRAIWLSGRRGAPLPPWADTVVNRIGELDAIETAEPNSSRPLDFDDVIEALRFLERVMHDDTCPPWIGRLSSGGVELAWRHGDVEVEAVFDRLRGDAVVIVAVGENEWDEPASHGDSLFATVVDRLSTSYIEHAATA